MKTRFVPCLMLLYLFFSGGLNAQSPAALVKMQQKYDAQHLQEMQDRTHYKYVGMLLFYSESFMVLDNGQMRLPTEPEIAAMDLDAYTSLRQEKDNVMLHDATLGKDILLLCRLEFEQVVLAQLSIEDAKAFEAYKAQSMPLTKKNND